MATTSLHLAGTDLQPVKLSVCGLGAIVASGDEAEAVLSCFESLVGRSGCILGDRGQIHVFDPREEDRPLLIFDLETRSFTRSPDMPAPQTFKPTPYTAALPTMHFVNFHLVDIVAVVARDGIEAAARDTIDILVNATDAVFDGDVFGDVVEAGEDGELLLSFDTASLMGG